MPRSPAKIVVVLTVLAQLTIGVSANFGMVFCVGENHAGIERASDDCCASHGTLGTSPVPTIERDCCSDIPLFGALSPLPEGLRLAAPLVTAVMTATGAPAPFSGRPFTVAVASPLVGALHRSVILRV
jgi:hypothetical protein